MLRSSSGRRPLVLAALPLLVPLLFGCSTDESIEAISFQVVRSDFSVRIPATGHLETAESTPISLPVRLNAVQTLEWIAEENISVKKGDVVARVDVRFWGNELEQQSLRVAQEDIKYQSKQQGLSLEAREIEDEAGLLEQEKVLADRFAQQDMRFLSHREVVDNMRSKAFVEARQVYNLWRGDTHEQKTESELGLLALQREQILNLEHQYSTFVENAEIRAPHDGLFIIATNPNLREKFRPGDMIFPGMTFASITDLRRYQARVYILESEASGLKTGQRVNLTLKAFPDEIIKGSIATIGAIATPRRKGNPLKYFECIVEITTPIRRNWRPALSLTAEIFAIEKPGVLTVPSQSLFLDEGGSHVYVRDAGVWARRAVEVGDRSLARTEIVDGLVDGDIVSLVDPVTLAEES